MELSLDQEEAMEEIEDWYYGPRRELTMGGLAGTGKTTIIGKLPRRLRLGPERIRFCAPTGKAASVLTSKLGGHVATTLHQLLYAPVVTHCLACPADETNEYSTKPCHGEHGCECGTTWQVIERDHVPDLVVVDESSMVPRKIYDDLKDLSDSGMKLLFVGDHGQLPPVKSSLNLMEDPEIKLETIHRQALGSPITRMAMAAREGVDLRSVDTDGQIPIVPMKHAKLDIDFNDPPLFICYKRKERVWANNLIRNALGLPDHPVEGDVVMCLRNNWKAGVHNGMFGRIVKIYDDGPDCYFAEIKTAEGTVYRGTMLRDQFASEDTLHGVGRGIDLWDYGYCCTVHKAQGSEADSVVILKGSLRPMGSGQRKRWLYTAITRAKQNLMIVDMTDG